MNTFKVSRQNKENKSKTISMRLTPSEINDLNSMKDEFGFETITDLVTFSMDILKKLYEWKTLSYHFYIGNPEKKDYKEVEIDFQSKGGEQ